MVVFQFEVSALNFKTYAFGSQVKNSSFDPQIDTPEMGRDAEKETLLGSTNIFTTSDTAQLSRMKPFLCVTVEKLRSPISKWSKRLQVR